jgi:capsular polysaccharide biosynthesis protein
VQPEERECVLLGAAPAHREWLFECLARLWMVRQRPSLEALPLLAQPGLGRWQRELLALLGYANDRIIEGPHDSTLLCREVHVPSLPGLGHFVAPAAVEHLRRELRAALPGEPATPRRIYVSRTGAPSRRLANEEEITALLRRHAFEIVQPGELAAAELLGLIQGADIVIGVEGAAMAHVFFAPPRASIGMIVADGLQSTRYYGPSAVLGQKFSFLLAQADYTSHRDHGECDLMLAPPVLERFLAQLQ